MLAVLFSAALLSAAHAAPATSSHNLTSKLEWRNIGPFIGGRSVAIAGVPDRENLFYMGSTDGGVWKSTNYGSTWNNITDGTLPSASYSIGAIAVAPSHRDTLYVGTGESDIRGDIITGDGVYKSTDAGKSWSYAGLRDTHTTSAIVVDPRDANVVYASSMGHVFKPNADRGVYKSTDGGRSWKKVLFVDDRTGAITVVMDQRHPNTLYASMYEAYRTPWTLQSGGAGSGLYKTTDGGAHWTNLTHTPGFPSGPLGRIGVSVAQSDPRIVYAIVQAKEGGVFRSTDGGAHWTRTNSDWKLRQRAFYYMSLYADPTNANVVYAPEVDGLFVSRNGGKTFERLRTPHGDNHIVWVNPRNPNVLLEGNDGGATVSTDGGKTWSGEHNQPTGQFYHVGIDDQFPFHVYGAQQDEGSFQGPSASKNGSISLGEWERAAYGESTFVVPQPGDTNVTYGSGYFSIFQRYDKSIGEYRSVSPWPLYQEGSASNELKYRLAWTHPILFTPSKDALLVGSQYVLRSDDQGQTWKEISPDLTRNDPKTEAPTGGPVDLDQTSAEVYPYVESLAVSPLDKAEIWAGSSDGLVHVTQDGGAHWSAVTPQGLPMRAEITSIEASHSAAGTAYLTASAYMLDDFHPYVYQTTDYGRHWSRITNGLPQDEYAFTVRQDPKAPSLLFVTTRSTVYASVDGGANWQSLALNLPKVQVRDLQIDTRQGAAVIATHGRAFWVLDNLALLEAAAQQKSTSVDGVRTFSPETAWLTHAYGSSEYGSAGSGKNPPFGATVFFHVPESYDGKTPVRLSFADASGKLVRSFELHRGERGKKETAIEPGMNRFQWDLRYAPATEVKGYYVPVAAGGLDDTVDGPTVVPGTYTVTLDYGATHSSASFDVKLDPRIRIAQDALADRLALEQQIHATLDGLDRAINHAIDMRERLTAGHHASIALTKAIDASVQLDSHSSEGLLLHEAKLRDHLAYLQTELESAYAKPTAAEYAVYAELKAKATQCEAGLASAEAAAKP